MDQKETRLFLENNLDNLIKSAILLQRSKTTTSDNTISASLSYFFPHTILITTTPHIKKATQIGSCFFYLYKD
jgi:hypothetical protein